MNTVDPESMYQYEKPAAMDRQLDVLQCHPDGGLLLGASCLTGRYWFGSLWYYEQPESAPDVESCTAGVQLEAGLTSALWIDNTHVLVGLDTGGVAVWRLEDEFCTFVLAHSAAGHDGVVTSASVTSDSKSAVTVSHDRCLKIWDLNSSSLTYSAKGHSDIISCIDCHPSKPDVFLSCAQDNRILLWDRRKPKPASLIRKHPVEHTPTCLAWQPGGQGHKFAVGSESGQVALLDTRAGVDNFMSAWPHDRPVHRLAFCTEKPSLVASVGEDCKTVVTSVLEADEMKQIYTDVSHKDFVQGLAWPSLARLYTCGWDNQVLQHTPSLGPGGDKSQPPTRLGQDVSRHSQGSGLTNGHAKEDGEEVATVTSNSSNSKISYSQALNPSQKEDGEVIDT